MYSPRSQFRRIKIALFSTLILFFITTAPDRQWAKAPAAAQCPTITVNPASLPGAALGVAYSQTFSASGGLGPYTFARTAGTLPPGLSLNSGGGLSGAPNATGAYNFTIQATGVNGCTGSRSYSILVVCPAIMLNPANLPGAALGAPYSQRITASGGDSPYTFSLVSGSLPPGMFFGSGGALGGTPTTPGNYSFLLRATDDNGCTGSRAYTLTVNCPNFLIFPANLPGATIGVSYSEHLTTTGGQAPYTYSLAGGSIPPGMFFGSSGVLGGTPNTVGAYSFTVRSTDAGNCADTRSYTVNVSCPDITLNLASLAGGQVGEAYSQTLTASGGQSPYTFSLFLGSLPPGLTLSASGAITGTPTAAGSHGFTVRARDANNCFGARAYTIVVDPACPPITITPPGLPDGSTGIAYSQNLNATGGGGRHTFAIVANSLPPGLTLLPASGAITGTPTTTGTYSFQVRATDSNGCAGTRAYTIVVNCGTITLTPATLPDASVRSPYSQTVTASGTRPPYIFPLTVGALPPGLNLTGGGTISGTPTTPGSYSFSLRVTDGNGCFTDKPYTINVACPPITVNPATLPAGTVGTYYEAIFSATGGAAPHTFSAPASALPPGLSFVNSFALAGTPTTPGRYSFIVKATNANGCAGDRSYTLVINPACPTITVNPNSAPVGQVGLFYSQTFSATGGTAPYAFRITDGAAPPGLSLASNGNLTGTPTTTGNYGFSVRATDANGCWGERSYRIFVNNPACPAIAVNPPILPVPRVGTTYNQTFSATGGTSPYSFSIASGTLPPGLSLSSAGNLTGAPTTTGSYTFTVRVTDANGCSGERTFTQNVLPCEGITISPTGTGVPSGRVGVAYSLTFTATGGTAPYAFSANSSFLPSGLTLSSSGLLSGTPTTGGNYSFMLVATSANGCVGSVLIFLNVNDPDCPDISISPSTLPTGTTGVAYNQTFTASGGAGPYSFTIASGALPAGFSLAINGNLTGTTTTAGNYFFSVRATDANGCAGVKGYQLVINNPTCQGLIVVNPSDAALPAGTTGVAYNQSFSATGGGAAPYSFSITLGGLPGGLSLSSSGNLTGTPTTAGNYSFTVRATDSNGCYGERTYTLVINTPVCPTITLDPASPLPSGRIATPYNQTITATGGASPYVFSLATGSALPSGVTLSSGGLLSGTPTVGGNFSFTIVATDANGCIGFRLYVLTLDPCPLITVNPAGPNLAPANVSAPYSVTFSASGGAAPYSFSLINVLPLGLTLNPTTGVLSGAPTQTGTFNFSVRATDANGCVGSRAYTLIVNSTCPAITVNPVNPNLPPATVGTAYSQTFTATGGAAPYQVISFSGTPPTGLSLDFTTGILSGTPTAPGTFTFTIGFKDAGQCPGERQYTLVVNNPACPTITINPAGLSNGAVGTAYNQMITATGGSSPYSFTVIAGALPAGLTLNATTGALAGTPATAGNYNFTVRATDANGCAGECVFAVTIAVSAVTSVSAASFATGGSLAAESIVAGFGSNLAASTQIALTLPLPTELAGVSLKVRDSAGVERLAPLFFASPTQINYLMPSGSSVGLANVTVVNGADVVAAGAVEIATVSPGMFSADGSGQGLASAIALRVRANGIQSFEPIARYDAALSRFVAVPIDVSSGADQVFLVFYGTGWRFRSALSAVSCSIGGVTSDVLYAGEVAGFVGYDQINVRLSPSLAGRGEVDVVITVDGKIANAVRIAIQ